jgi:hypothetical protein
LGRVIAEFRSTSIIAPENFPGPLRPIKGSPFELLQVVVYWHSHRFICQTERISRRRFCRSKITSSDRAFDRFACGEKRKQKTRIIVKQKFKTDPGRPRGDVAEMLAQIGPKKPANIKHMKTYYAVAGDLHLDKIQYGLSVRYEDNLRCLSTIVEDVEKNPQARGLILTGDTFNKKTLLPKYQMLLARVHQRIKQVGKSLLAIDGNHDRSDSSWLDTVDLEINADGKFLDLAGCQAAFFSFCPRAELLDRLKTLPKVNAIFLHGRLLELMPWAASQQNPDYDFSANEIREVGISGCTFFLGDLHTYCDYADRAAINWFVYSGSTEMTQITEGSIVSHRFGNRYDPVKKYLRFYPGRKPGENWETVDLPNRPFLRRVVSATERPESAISFINDWVEAHPQGILAVYLPDEFRRAFRVPMEQWRDQLLTLFDVPLPGGDSKPLQDLRDTDLLQIADRELTLEQAQILKTVLTNEPFDTELGALLSGQGKEAA